MVLKWEFGYGLTFSRKCFMAAVGQLGDALKLSSSEFETKYGRALSKDQETIFHCKLGGRAQKAAELAKSLGFEK